MRWVPLVGSLLGGCVAGPGAVASAPVDLAAFAAPSEVIERSCGTAGCHGGPERPLAVYARYEWRADEPRLSDEPLTSDELRHNAAVSAGFVRDADVAARAPLLLRPLHPSAGGTGHGGGAQFADALDPDYQLLHSWAEEVLR